MMKKCSKLGVTVRCCSALLKIDTETSAVISHVAAKVPRMVNDIEDAARAMKEQDSRRDSIFRQSVENQKHASDLLEKKLQEAVKKAEESSDTWPPIRELHLES